MWTEIKRVIQWQIICLKYATRYHQSFNSRCRKDSPEHVYIFCDKQFFGKCIPAQQCRCELHSKRLCLLDLFVFSVSQSESLQPFLLP